MYCVKMYPCIQCGVCLEVSSYHCFTNENNHIEPQGAAIFRTSLRKITHSPMKEVKEEVGRWQNVMKMDSN